MRVLGIDPGSLRTGWGIVDRNGNRLTAVAAGVIRLDGEDELHVRLKEMHEALTAIIGEHAPDEVAVEDIFQAKFDRSALKLGQARGVALLAAAQAERPVHAYPPALVKRTVGGGGRADKQQVAQLVGAILGLKVLPKVDATDALAVAITHAQARRVAPIARRPGSRAR
ncbi:MAG: crossover junction endodeoxyribonuclease RuvC [Myxococcales bacterium]|nr:crossover junction endodeoxyribonuclease RuvC [Myxococcales bacterium]